ncbi:MAG TPA: nuclear transport factor 2 family protein [Vicinamibacteria bacterium]|nr:nuclear transport factor 2 family protein [Vicinamibacteria bacterium]
MATRCWKQAVLGTLLVVAGSAVGVRAGEVAVRTEVDAVTAAHDRRIVATISADLTGLDSMMTDDLTYTHSSGATETKAELLDALKTGKYVYREITPRDRKVRIHGNAAIVSGPCHVVIEPGGKRTEIDLYFTELYVKEGGRWRMALWQSTRLPAPAPATK